MEHETDRSERYVPVIRINSGCQTYTLTRPARIFKPISFRLHLFFMTQAHDKKSGMDVLEPNNLPFTESNLADAQSIDSSRGGTRDVGFAHHLVKPVDPDTIHKLIISLRLNGG